MRKPLYPTCRIEYAGQIYQVDLRILPGRVPSRAGADSPDHLRPGTPRRASVIRILDGKGIVVHDQATHDLSYWAVREISNAALKLAGKGGACFGSIERKPVPTYEDAENYR